MRTIRAIVRPHTIIKWNVKRTLFIMENLKQIKKSNDINMPQISPKLKLLKTYNFFVRVHNCVVFSQSSRQLIRQHSLVGSKLSLLNNLNHQHEYDQPEEPSCQNAPAQSVQIHVWNTNAQEHGYDFYKIEFLLFWIKFIRVIRFIKNLLANKKANRPVVRWMTTNAFRRRLSGFGRTTPINIFISYKIQNSAASMNWIEKKETYLDIDKAKRKNSKNRVTEL